VPAAAAGPADRCRLAPRHLRRLPLLHEREGEPRHLFYERDLRSVTCNTRQDGRELLAEAAQILVRPHTTVYPLAEANRALQDLKADRVRGTAVLMVE